MDIAPSPANRRAERRLRLARGSVYEAFDGLACGFDHDEALEFLAGAPSFQAIPEDRRGIVAGIVLGFAMVAVESDRGHR